MAIITGNKKSKAAQDKRQAYTWAACIMVAVFVIAIAAPLLSSGSKSEEDYRARAYDLAQLPFNNDAAEEALLAQAQYSDIPKNDLINSIYSKEDKAERQATDAVEGVPAPPDDEYKAAAVQRERKEARTAARENARRAAAERVAASPTRVGSLSRSSMATSGGASSGVSARIWTREDQQRNSGATASNPNSQLLAKVNARGGRATGFTDAYMKSSGAANAKDADAAAAGAVDAFAKGVTADSAKVAEGKLEKDAKDLELNADALASKDLSKNDLDQVDKAADKLDDKKKDNDAKEQAEAFNWFEIAKLLLNTATQLVQSKTPKAPEGFSQYKGANVKVNADTGKYDWNGKSYDTWSGAKKAINESLKSGK